jgi:hypothetical protein
MRYFPLTVLILIVGCAKPSPPQPAENFTRVSSNIDKSPTIAQPPAGYSTGNPAGIGTPPFHDEVPAGAPTIVGRWSTTSAADGSTLVIEFRPDGTASSVLNAGNNELKCIGTYTMNGLIGTVNLKSPTPPEPPGPAPGQTNTAFMTIQIRLARDGNSFVGDGSTTFTRL